MNTVPIRIYRHRDKTVVEADLHTDLAPSILSDAEKEWGPIRISTARELQRQGRTSEIPQHFGWDWGAKSGKLQLLAYRSLGIECAGKWQGLMMVRLSGKVARLDPDRGKDIVYVEYLESAPWNLAMMVGAPEYGGIGSVLMSTAVQLSMDEGFHGRIGLHALPQAEEFYRDVCGMHCCGPDASYQDLPYYEMTRDGAARFLSNSGGAAI